MQQTPDLETGDQVDPFPVNLVKHSSRLPNPLYILSFAPQCPSAIRQPHAFFTHPYVLYFVGTVAALLAGAGLPAFDIVFGFWANGIREIDAPASRIKAAGSEAGWIITMLGVIFILLFTVSQICMSNAGIIMSNHLRETYLAAVLVQDQAFFDRVGPGEIVMRASKDVDSIRTGLGDRLGYLVWSCSTIITALVSAFIHAPRLAGVLFVLLPFTMGLFSALGYWGDQVANRCSPLDGKASSFIEQAMSSVRIIQSFNMGDRIIRKLDHDMLHPIRKLTRIKSAVKGFEQAAGYGAGFLVYSMSIWYGGKEVVRGISVGDVLVTFYNYVNLFFAFATVVPHLIATTTAIQNIGFLRLQIERDPLIDVRDQSGMTLPERSTWEPSFELRNVTFAYPSRPGHKALDDVSVVAEAGKFTAFVGPSGSGKSTLAALLMRLYDPRTATYLSELDRHISKTIRDAEGDGSVESIPEPDDAVSGDGVVLFAGHDIRTLNLKWLRLQVAVVPQSPQLVTGSIFYNVAIGLTGTDLEYREDDVRTTGKHSRLSEIDARVEEALRKAEAWDFVQSLPDRLSTVVTGGRTGVLSGGQVQRIALARALVRRPKCLLLDEATSIVAADAEANIQTNLLEDCKNGMTLVVIAHRLSTTVHADKIVVMVDGRPVHSGAYDELLEPSCPDQTFRSMALVNPQAGAPKTKRFVDDRRPFAHSSTSPTLVGERAEATEKTGHETTPDLDLTPVLPPPMHSVKQAFGGVKYLLLGGTGLGIAAGSGFVVAAWLYGRSVAALNDTIIFQTRVYVDRWALWFLILAIGTFAVMFFHATGLEYSGERIVADLRRESVRALIRQDIAFFEDQSAGSGGFTAAATSHPSNVGVFVGLILAQIINTTANFSGTIILAFALSWRLAILILPSLAVTMILGYVNFIFLNRFEASVVKENERQANFVGEAANSFQMLAVLTREGETIRLFREKFLSRPLRQGSLVAASFSGAAAQGMIELFAALMFYWGARQVAKGRVSLAALFSVVEAVVVAIYISAKILTYTGDFTRMRNSLHVIQSWIDRESALSTEIGPSSLEQSEKCDGIELEGVSLRYPSRPETLSLNSIDIRMQYGKSYAFCGASGAGKSSILAVLQRFYDTTSGSIRLDGVDIRSMGVNELRSHMGYVSQEPILFEETIRWNLVASALDPDTVTDGELEWACEQASIMDFIRTLPLGFDTDPGTKGGQVSGGQKQRLCIARAILRNPRILLLDEATKCIRRRERGKRTAGSRGGLEESDDHHRRASLVDDTQRRRDLRYAPGVDR